MKEVTCVIKNRRKKKPRAGSKSRQAPKGERSKENNIGGRERGRGGGEGWKQIVSLTFKSYSTSE